MLTTQEQKFINYWAEKRKENKLNPFFLGKGFAIGLVLSLIILYSNVTGWYKRIYINFINPNIMFIATLSISFFLALFYNSFKYEQNEQFYQELLIKKKKCDNS